MATQPETSQLDLGYEIFIAFVSILSVTNMFLVYVPGLDPDAMNVVYTINAILTVIFLFDFGLRFYTAPARSYYFWHDFGWADLLACVPILRFLRLFRIFKAYRLIKRYGTKKIAAYLSRHRAEAALYILVFAVILIIEAGSVMVIMAERASPSANITTASDAMWWVYVTITTVGYGDRYPVTTMGRLAGVMVMTTGVGVFATFAGFIANKLLTSDQKEEEMQEQVQEQVQVASNSAAKSMAELMQYLKEREKIDTEITTRLTKIEHLLAETARSESGTLESVK
jgi:voltage-gated potassium channel